jgi:hypothetical protein
MSRTSTRRILKAVDIQPITLGCGIGEALHGEARNATTSFFFLSRAREVEALIEKATVAR